VSGTGNEVDYNFNAYNKNSNFTYDYMGNVTGDGVCTPAPCWSYDDAGQLTTGNGASYLYDGVGRRQQKTDPAGAGGTVRDFVFDGNSPYTEFAPGFARQTGGFYTYANGTTYFNRTDQLGTPRLSTDYAGAVQRKEGSLMGPWGDNFTETGPLIDFTGFAGGFWDAENDGEHFGAREYENIHGSWLSPDPSGMAAVDISNPQTWNRYAYVLNNPVSFTDPTGLDCAYLNDDQTLNHLTAGDCDNSTDALANSGYYFDGTVNQNSPMFIDSNANVYAQVGGDYQCSGDANCPGQGSFVNVFGGSAPLASPLTSGITVAANNGSPTRPPTPKICGGTFTFAGKEIDGGEAGGFAGAIHEYDTVNGNSVGSLVELWGGGEGPVLGGGKITMASNPRGGWLGFTGVGLSGVFAGVQVGYATGYGWGGLYFEGHIGPVALGGGGYVSTSCKKGG
jgi:RHS repeat-associated protein